MRRACPIACTREYLRNLFLNNDLAEGRFLAGGKPITLTDIRTPVFAVGTERDHIAPWRSTYKVNLQFDTEVTYLLTSGGHNAGIVSEPGHAGRSFRITTKNPTIITSIRRGFTRRRRARMVRGGRNGSPGSATAPAP